MKGDYIYDQAAREDEKPVMTEKEVLDVISKHRGGLYPDDFDIAKYIVALLQSRSIPTAKPVVDIEKVMDAIEYEDLMYLDIKIHGQMFWRDCIEKVVSDELKEQGFEVK